MLPECFTFLGKQMELELRQYCFNVARRLHYQKRVPGQYQGNSSKRITMTRLTSFASDWRDIDKVSIQTMSRSGTRYRHYGISGALCNFKDYLILKKNM